MYNNKVLSTLNQPLAVELYSIAKPDGASELFSTIDGLPLGTSTNAQDGELAVKVILVGQRESDDTNGIIDSGPANGINGPIVPDDNTDLVNHSRGILVNGAGDLEVIDLEGNTTIIEDILVGLILPLRVTRIKATNTTATLIYVLY